jgi:hypothetical protein
MSAIILSVIFSECHKYALYVECRSDKCRGATYETFKLQNKLFVTDAADK